MDGKSFCNLFYKALHLHRREFFVDDNSIQQAIIALQNEHSPKQQWRSSRICCPINYNNPAFRCAYLHKYASCHAVLVQEVLLSMINVNPLMLWNSILYRESISVCCLGGGPGTDIIGLLSVFSSFREFQNSSFHFTVVDCMTEWQHALVSVMRAAQSTQFQFLSSFLSSWNYLQADMLSCIPEDVMHAIQSADMITMVKFVSAAASEATRSMIRTVFNLLKPGALVFFIDNAAGGYYEMVLEEASTCGLSVECDPFQHVRFGNKIFRQKMFGFFSLSYTTITAQMWKKNYPLFCNPYESYWFLPMRSEVRLYGERQHTSVSSSKFRHERRAGKRTSASASLASTNSNNEQSQKVLQVVKESRPTFTDPGFKEELPSTSSHQNFSSTVSETITISETITSKRRLSAADEPSPSKRKVSPNESESVCISSKAPSTSKPKQSEEHANILNNPSRSDAGHLSTRISFSTMRKRTSSSKSLEDKASQLCAIASPPEDTPLAEFQHSIEKVEHSDSSPDLEENFSLVLLIEDASLGATQENTPLPLSEKLQPLGGVSEAHPEKVRHDSESQDRISGYHHSLPAESSCEKDINDGGQTANGSCWISDTEKTDDVKDPAKET